MANPTSKVCACHLPSLVNHLTRQSLSPGGRWVGGALPRGRLKLAMLPLQNLDLFQQLSLTASIRGSQEKGGPEKTRTQGGRPGGGGGGGIAMGYIS